MGRAFLLIYGLFHHNLWAFILFILLTLGFEAWFVSHLQLEEDINKVIPSSEKNEQLITVLQHSKFADRLVFCITLKDPAGDPDPNLLIAYAESLIDSLEGPAAGRYIKAIEDKFSPTSLSGIHDLFYNNLPLFLDEGDYHTIDGMLNDSSIALAIKKDYEALITPGGFAIRNFILKDPLSLTSLALKKLESLKVSENFELYQDYIVSKDRRNLLFFIIPANSSTETSENAALLKLINNFKVSLDEHYNGRTSTYYFGSMAVSNGNASQIKRDIILTVSIAGLFLLVFLGLYFRKKITLLFIFLPAVMGGGFALAILTLLNKEVSAISLGLGSVMLGISIDYALHFFSHLRHTGSVKTVIKDISNPVIISSITTASAFLCLMVLKSEALRDLGLFAALSVTASAIFTLTILPHFLSKEQGADKAKKPNPVVSSLNWIASYAYDNNRKLTWAIFILLILFLFTSGWVKFESSMDGMNYMSPDLVESEDFLDSISAYKLRSVYIVSTSAEVDGALALNESIIQAVDSLLVSGTVKTYTSIHPFYPSAHSRDGRIGQWKNFWTPEKSNQLKQTIINISAEYRFREDAFEDFYQLIDYENKKIGTSDLRSLKEAFLDEYITGHDSLVMITTILKVRSEDKPDVYDVFEGRDDIIVFDRQSLTSSFMDGLRDGFDKLVILSLLVVFIILTLSFGRIELGIITFIPLLISWVWTLGIMGLFGIRFNIFNIVISTFIFGLGIDYAIFCMRGLIQEYQYGTKKLRSYKTSIMLSGITTIVGIGVLIFAKHPALQSIAISAIIGILSVILITYTILPRLFRFLIEHEGRKRKWPATFKDFLFSINTFMIFLVGVIILNISGLILKFLVPIRMSKKKMIFHKMLSMATWTIVYGSINIRKFIWNRSGEDFKKPAVVVCTHQSHLDTVLTIMLNPKMILITAPWVQKSFFFGWFIRFADFYSVGPGIDSIMDKIQARVEEGYSILFFPEGTRSTDLEIGRFHQGAFHLAKELDIDILPIISYGSGNTMPKFEPFLKTSPSTMTIMPRIKQNDPLVKDTALATAKSIRHYMKEEYAEIRKQIETPAFYRKIVVRNYLYRSPILEWYMKVKIRMDNHYILFHENLPENGIISDIGCGYGFMSYMLKLMSPGRKILAYDHDQEKIDTANNCALKDKNISFIHTDITIQNFESSDAFLLVDVLHYIPEDAQEILIANCVENLKDDGVIIIRDADTGMRKKHFGTRISEALSTGIGFNKTLNNQNKLFFISGEKYLRIFSQLNLEIKTIDETKMTSNLIYILKKKP